MGFALEPGQYHPLPQVVLTRPALPQKSEAPTARYIKAQGKREARRPGFSTSTRDRGLKGRNTQGITPFQGWSVLIVCYQGRRAPLRFALAPGSHIPRRWRSPFRL